MRIMIVGMLEGYITTAGKLAADRGARVSHVTSIDQALEDLRAGKGADLLMVDVRLDVPLLLQSLTTERIAVPVVACGVGPNKAASVAAIHAGAKEYLPLPPDPDLIAAVIEAVAHDAREILHQDPRMQELVRLADQIAPSDVNILITGESGTGKEVVARYVHDKSKRSKQAFVSLNCAAIPENLMESELFGHEKGAFTGAIARRIGKFEEASGGTLLLDEISEMAPHLQAKLLRALQEKEITRIGGNKSIKINLRVLATSNRNLEDEIRKGTFREDLYFRLNVMHLSIPPLHSRPQDILYLAHHFIHKFSLANNTPVRPISAQAQAALLAHRWPGNVRELENCSQRAVLLATGPEITTQAFLLTTPQPQSSLSLPFPEKAQPLASGEALVGRTLADVEKDLIITTFHHCLGNRTQTAHILGISIRTLRNKLKLYAETLGDNEESSPESPAAPLASAG